MSDNAFTPGQGVPSRLVAGDLWQWRADGLATAYPADTFGLSYVLAPKAGGTPTTAPAVADANGWGVTVAAATTATLAAGTYAWTLFATRTSDGARQTVCAGALEVAPDPAGAGDTRTAARKMLDAINAVLEGRITKNVESYSIEGRSLTRVPFEVLRNTRARLMREVQAEDALARGRRPGPRYQRMRF